MRWALPLASAVAAFCAFLPVLSAGFLDWDDNIVLTENPAFRGLGVGRIRWMFTNMVGGHYQPLTWFSYALDHAVWGMDPFGYHLTNLALHALTAVLVFFLARRLIAAALEGSSGWPLELGALLASLLFAVHPLRVEPVAWVTSRRDILSSFLYIAAVLAWLRAVSGPEARRGWLGASLGLHVLALLAKVTAMTLPLALLVLDVYPLRRLGSDPRQRPRPAARSVLMEKVPFLLASLLAVIVGFAGRVWAVRIDPPAEWSLLKGMATAVYGLAFYPLKTLWPTGLAPLYELPSPFDPFRPGFIASAAAVLAASAALWRWRSKMPGLAAAAVFYLVVVFPMAGLVPPGVHLVADRYAYVSCMGFAVLAGGALTAFLMRRPGRGQARALAAACVLVLAVLGRLSWAQSQCWRDPETLWWSVLAKDQGSSIGHNNLAVSFAMQGRRADAVEHFRKAHALRPMNRDYRERLMLGLYNLGSSELEQGRPGEALPAFEEAASLGAGSADLYVNFGLALARTGRLPEACRRFSQALRLDPGSALAEFNWGNALSDLGRHDEAALRYQLALDKAPGLVEARFNLANTLARQGRLMEALEHYERVRVKAPGYSGLAENIRTVRRHMAGGTVR
ncbi:MAG: tetratricopeptide repeat protein [Elusimicrobiota bacterium]|jgi:Flp pilus assembly protein TadD